jgi:hypothetical protein
MLNSSPYLRGLPFFLKIIKNKANISSNGNKNKIALPKKNKPIKKNIKNIDKNKPEKRNSVIKNIPISIPEIITADSIPVTSLEVCTTSPPL